MQSKLIKTHQPCPDCGSSDALAYYDDGHTYCFSCSTTRSNADVGLGINHAVKTQPRVSMKELEALQHESVAVVERGITKQSMHYFGAGSDGSKYYFPYADSSGKVVACKTRGVNEKTFGVLGDWKDAQLFGQHLFNAGGKAITITEGEFDAIAVFQMTGSKYPVVSIRNGAH